MDEINEIPARRPLRRRKSHWEIFKAQSLPSLILLAAVIMILILIIGATGRNAETVAYMPGVC